MTVIFRPMEAEDVVRLNVQPSQAVGLCGPVRTLEHGRQMIEAGPCWAALDALGEPIVIAGIGNTIWDAAGHAVQGVAWALLADQIGHHHAAITRFARRTILGSPLRRIEAIVRTDQHKGRLWAELCGFELNTVLLAYGADSSPHLLFERIK